MRRAMERYRLELLAEGAPFYAIPWVLFGMLPWARREYVELITTTDGEGLLNISRGDGGVTSRPLRPGQLYFLRPRDVYQIVSVESGSVGGYLVSMPVSSWLTFAQLIGLSAWWLTTEDPPEVAYDPGDPAIVEPFERIAARYRDDPTLLDLAALLVAVFPALLPAAADKDRATIPPWLSDTVVAMHTEANLRAGVPRMLELARVSSSHLSRVVRRFFGITPSALVLDLRLRHAAVLLTTTALSVGAIATRCGFSSTPYFTTAFGRATRLTPREYRRRHEADLPETDAFTRAGTRRTILPLRSALVDIEHDPRAARAKAGPGRVERVVIVGS